MERLGKYDPELQMFINEPRDLNPGHLRFLRHLVRIGKFDDDIFGEPKIVTRLTTPDLLSGTIFDIQRVSLSG